MSDQPGHILVVDDHRTNRLKISMAIKKLGHTVETAEDGRQALDLLASQPFDVVLLDIIMPEMDGYQVLAKMKTDHQMRNIPVVVISAEQDLDSVAKGITLGAEDYLDKRFDPTLLEARINACLEKKRFRDQEVAYLRQVECLTAAAKAIENDTFDPASLSEVASRDDALGQLTRLFQQMACEFQTREQKLKQQVQNLRIEIDQTKAERQAATITGTDYFKSLRENAQQLRDTLE